MLKDRLKRLMRGEDLSEDEAAQAIGSIMDGKASPAEIAAFLVALRMKGETVDEIAGAAAAMRARMSRVEVKRRPLVDTCGTGGDGASTFNISTVVAFVVAAAGVTVAKHGNRAVSSRSGSADVLAAAGLNLEASVSDVSAAIESLGIGFLFAPNLHPAMRHAGPVRRELGVRTIFNVLGPLTNPAGAPRQLVGVFDRDLLRPVAEVLGRLGSEHAWVVRGRDGLDELTTTDDSDVAEWDGKSVRMFVVSPEQVGLSRTQPEALRGGSPEENAGLLREILAGTRPGPMSDIVALNAAAALLVAGTVTDLGAGVRRAQEILGAGAGLKLLEQLTVRLAAKA